MTEVVIQDMDLSLKPANCELSVVRYQALRLRETKCWPTEQTDGGKT